MQFPQLINHSTMLESEPILLDGMKVVHVQRTLLQPVELESPDNDWMANDVHNTKHVKDDE
jgi:hypothetical protein